MRHPSLCLLALAFSCAAYGQVTYPGKTIHVHDLPPLTARSTHASDVLAASLEIVFNDKDVCCGKNSALEASVASDPGSLKDIGSRLQGKHLLSDGRAIMVTAEYLTPDQVSAGHLIYMLAANHAPLMLWNSHLYVVNGVSYAENFDANGGVSYVTDTFFCGTPAFLIRAGKSPSIVGPRTRARYRGCYFFRLRRNSCVHLQVNVAVPVTV